MSLQIEETIKRIINLIRLNSGILRDDFLKNNKNVVLLGNHTLIITLLIVLIGLFNIYILYSNIDKTKENTLIINTEKAIDGVLIYNESNIYYQINPSEDLPFFMQVTVNVDYKEPIMRGSNINLKRICISTKKKSNTEGFYPNINKFDLNLYEKTESAFSYTEKGFNIANFKQNNLTNLFYLKCFDYKDSLALVEPDIKDEYGLNYKLEYTDEDNRTYKLNGISNFEKTIKGASEFDEMNIRINKSILFLTAWLIILGSVPFSLSLKQLLEGKDK